MCYDNRSRKSATATVTRSDSSSEFDAWKKRQTDASKSAPTASEAATPVDPSIDSLVGVRLSTQS